MITTDVSRASARCRSKNATQECLHPLHDAKDCSARASHGQDPYDTAKSEADVEQ